MGMERQICPYMDMDIAHICPYLEMPEPDMRCGVIVIPYGDHLGQWFSNLFDSGHPCK